MKIVQSLWTAARQPSRDDAMRWALSFTLAKRHYGAVELHTDDYGKRFLVDQIGLDYDKVHLTLQELDKWCPPNVWALSKVVVFGELARQGEPFLHLDDDVFLFNRLPGRIECADVFAQCSEGFNYYRRPLHYFDEEDRIDCALPESEWRAYNTGIFGGSNLEFIRQYSERSRLLAERIIAKGNAKEHCNTVFEQAFLAKAANDLGVKVTTLLAGGYNDEQAVELGYCHLIQLKGKPEVIGFVESKLKKENAILFQRISRMFDDSVPSLRAQGWKNEFRVVVVSPRQFPRADYRNFNGSLAWVKDGFRLFYRTQPAVFWDGFSEIWAADCDPFDHPRLWNHRPVVVDPANHLEDPRIFFGPEGRVGLTYVVACHNNQFGEWGCEQKAVWLDDELKPCEEVWLPNTGKLREKNWLVFWDESPKMVYSVDPHIVIDIQTGERWESAWEMEWKWGEPRGGTTPELHNGLYWTFFHSSFGEVNMRRYAVGAYAFEGTPPFRPVYRTRRPLLMGTHREIYLKDRDRPGYNPKVVFPMSAFFTNGHWNISLGVNDSSQGFIRVAESVLSGKISEVR